MSNFFAAALAIAAFASAEPADAPPTLPKPAADALQDRADRIAASYGRLPASSKRWSYKISSVRKGEVPPPPYPRLQEAYCVTIDNPIATFTDWKILNFVVTRESGTLWEAEDAIKEAFQRFGCGNFKQPDQPTPERNRIQ